MTLDVIDQIVGIAPGDRLDTVRRGRLEARTHAQGSYDALFAPVDDHAFPRHERFAVATFVALLHELPAAADFYAARLLETDGGTEALLQVLRDEAENGRATGPYGEYAEAALAGESTTGPELRIDSVHGAYVLGDRLCAALEHAHMLVFHPRDASRAHLQALLDAGWTTDGIVSLSQLVSFLTFQLRVVHGLSVLAAASTPVDGEENA